MIRQLFIRQVSIYYRSIISKLKGKETVASRILKIEKEARQRLDQHLRKASFETGYPEQLILLAFKEEQVLQLYATGNKGTQLIKEYPFTAYSGSLGPKLKEGDKQIPEGIYKVEYLNPNSAYYLSIKIDYPNAFDIAKTELANVSKMGGDIFIHGKAATIGCIPIGDAAIEEVFLLTQKAITKDIKIIISPRDFRVNASYPEISAIDWEQELYDQISTALTTIPLSS